MSGRILRLIRAVSEFSGRWKKLSLFLFGTSLMATIVSWEKDSRKWTNAFEREPQQDFLWLRRPN
jgi:hypothetical protein